MQARILMLCFRLKNLLEAEDGQDLIEYGLITCLASVASIAAVRSLAVPINSFLASVNSALSSV